MSTDLAHRTTARELAIAFERAARDVRAAFAQIAAAETAVNAAFGNTEGHRAIRVSACGDQWRDNFNDVEQAIEIMTRAAWRTIVDRLELRRFMSIAWPNHGRITEHIFMRVIFPARQTNKKDRP